MRTWWRGVGALLVPLRSPSASWAWRTSWWFRSSNAAARSDDRSGVLRRHIDRDNLFFPECVTSERIRETIDILELGLDAADVAAIGTPNSTSGQGGTRADWPSSRPPRLCGQDSNRLQRMELSRDG